MSKELFIALSGGLAYQRHLELVANNAANISTVGFKSDRPVFSVATPDFTGQAREVPAKGTAANLLAHSYAAAIEGYTDMSGGAIKLTGVSTDVALDGEGFFVVETPAGERYTRDGQLKINKEGVLVTPQNQPVLGESGPIRVSSNAFSISPDGTIVEDGIPIGKLRIEAFDPGVELTKQGDTMFQAVAGASRPATDTLVVQGGLELSNAEPVRAMIDLVNVQRQFESFTRVVTAIDDLDKKINARVKA